jgi:hypothetical protein
MRDPYAQILGGDVRISCADPARLTMLNAYESIFAFRMHRYIAREGFIGTGNLVVRRSAIQHARPFPRCGRNGVGTARMTMPQPGSSQRASSAFSPRPWPWPCHLWQKSPKL